MSSRRRARIAVPAIITAGAALLGGVLAPAPAGAQADQPVDITLAYTCTPADPTPPPDLEEPSAEEPSTEDPGTEEPSTEPPSTVEPSTEEPGATLLETGETGAEAPGTLADPVTLGVRVTFPLSVTAGDLIQPFDPVLRLSAPSAAFGALTAAGATSATSTVRVDTAVAQPFGTFTDVWNSYVDTPVEVPADGDWVFEAPADMPPTFANDAGVVTYTPGVMAVSVTGYTGDGTPTDPPSVDLTCTPDQETVIATIEVIGPPPPVIPEECHQYEGAGPEFFNWFCSYMGGYANVKKLNASVLQPPGMQNIATTLFSFQCAEGEGILCFRARTLPDFEGRPQLPPAPGSFWAFGFVPVTGTLRITQPEPSDIYAWSTFTIPATGLTTVRVKLSARLEDTTVNGVPLDVGENCRTAVPIDATFTGDYDHYSITEGGVLSGTITIPPFSGCGVDEDLDPILTGLVSGPGNYVKLTQGNVCYFLTGTGFCPPDVPEPQR
jgi:hypothetical protein